MLPKGETKWIFRNKKCKFTAKVIQKLQKTKEKQEVKESSLVENAQILHKGIFFHSVGANLTGCTQLKSILQLAPLGINESSKNKN